MKLPPPYALQFLPSRGGSPENLVRHFGVSADFWRLLHLSMFFTWPTAASQKWTASLILTSWISGLPHWRFSCFCDLTWGGFSGFGGLLHPHLQWYLGCVKLTSFCRSYTVFLLSSRLSPSCCKDFHLHRDLWNCRVLPKRTLFPLGSPHTGSSHRQGLPVMSVSFHLWDVFQKRTFGASYPVFTWRLDS